MLIRRALLTLFALCILLGPAVPALAHDPSLSGIRILYRRADVVVNVTTHISRLLRSEGKDHAALTPVALDQAIRRRLHLRIDGRDRLPASANVIGDNANDLLTWQTILPGAVKQCEVLARLYPEDPNSRTVVTILRDGRTIQDTLLDAAHPDLQGARPAPGALEVALRYVHEGIGHIFGGPDHILFVLGLLLLGGTLRSLLKTVTAFTLAHSITLTLAATGVFSPSPRIIEPLIALSIVAIAIENGKNLRTLRNRRLTQRAAPGPGDEDRTVGGERDRRPYYAFGFGLIHGFGFAGALAEVGLPREALGVALASFNIGVEIGQAAIVVTVSPLLAWFALKRPTLYRRAAIAGSMIIGIAGAYWFITRLFPSS